jgi:hypothetical protein
LIKNDIERYFDGLPGRGDHYCFNGLLRSFCQIDDSWISAWSLHSGLSLDCSELMTYDVFGSIYGVDYSGNVYILSLDSGDKSSLDINVDEFFRAIAANPASTIRSDLYDEARFKLGILNNFQNYAMKVEAALGGELCMDNMYICERLKHASVLGDIARQIKNLPAGMRLNLDYK